MYCTRCRKSWQIKTPTLQPEDFDFRPNKKNRRAIEKEDVYVITSAMNNTPVHPEAWKAVKRMAREMGARLLVIPVRYKNPTSTRENRMLKNFAWWPKEVKPYLVEGELHLHPLFRVLGQVRVQATAVNPLVGLEGLSGPASAVFGHGQIAMKTVPTPQQALPKFLYTTGSVSDKGSERFGAYSDTKAGIKGHFHHSLGVLIAEKEGPRIHLRSITGDKNGCFEDLDRHYGPKGSRKITRLPGLVTGDGHGIFMDPEVKAATYTNKDSIVNRYRPEKIVRHDEIDSFSITHWHNRDQVARFVKLRDGITLEYELDHLVALLDETTPEWAESLMVASNHHDHIMRWLNEVDWRKDLANAKIFHRLWTAILDAAELVPGVGVESVDPLEAYVMPRLRKAKGRVRFLDRHSDVTIKDILITLHGDVAANGARGGILPLSKLGVKVIIGHGHSSGIHHGATQVGHGMGPRRDFHKGPGSATVSHCAITPNGKRILFHLIDGKHRR